MNFDFSDDQQAIKRTAKDLLADRFKLERVREHAEAGSYDEDAWKELCELGWPGIFVDEQYGGQGLGVVELRAAARARQLDRGRHDRDPQEHRRRERARPALSLIHI